MRKFVFVTVGILLFFSSGVSAKSRKGKKKGFVKINLNKAPVAELKKIPGISKSKAKRIVENRPFSSIEDLKEISHETKSGKTSFDFATSKGKWRKSFRLLVDAGIFTLKDGTDAVDQIALYKKLFPQPVDINKATLKELSALPGISKSKAKRIVENRPFLSIEDLKEISHETKSGKTSYDFATKKGRWKKAIKPLIESGRLVCGSKKKSGKKRHPKKKKKPAKIEEEEFPEYEEY
ncbi:MAG: helix-hairpin-helix domain-containing protein [Elusimicrobia bacterium]|nr:helix-hairpin-helix domain-containing protein [Elusimicrobiota bacterium]